jgi:arylsulfatase A-like enzyme
MPLIAALVLALLPLQAADAARPEFTLTVERVTVRMGRGSRPKADVTLRAVVRGRTPPPSLSQAVIRLDGGGAFSLALALPGCTPRIGRCGGRGMRSVVRRRPTRTPTWRIDIAARDLAPSVDSAAAPHGPIVVSFGERLRGGPPRVLSRCVRLGRGGLACRPAPPPDVVLVVTDDQRWDTLAYMPVVQERLAARGVTFTNAFVTTSLCCPSRASILTGRYAHEHGVWTIGSRHGGAPGFVGADGSTIATWLQSAGYRTGLFGKYMNSYTNLGPPRRPAWYVPPGWDVWRAFPVARYHDYALLDERGGVRGYGRGESDYSTDVLTHELLEFVSSAVGERTPYFAVFTPFAPHVEPVEGFWPVPAARHQGAFALLPPFRPPSYNEPDVSDKPSPIHERSPLTPMQLLYVDVLRVNQLGALLAVDDAVRAITDRVRALGRARDTVVIYTSDNGYCWGEHRLFGKECPYEECHRVPLVVRNPRAGDTPVSDARLVANIDLAPTIAALAGIVPPTPVDGLGLVSGAAAPAEWRSALLFEHWAPDDTPDYRAVRTEAFKYVERLSTGEAELYDLVADPYELENRITDPVHASVVVDLRARLAGLAGAP